MNKFNKKMLSMISRIVLSVFVWGTVVVPAAQALDEVEAFNTNYPIRQEQIAENGVYVSRPNHFDKEVFDAFTVNRIRTLEAYSKWLRAKIRYVEDGAFDEWATPEETLRKKAGDCEDYAILNLTILRKMGFEARFVGLFRPGEAHAICVVKQNGMYAWFDNAKLQRTEARTLNELAQIISEKYAYHEVKEYNLNTQDWEMVYKRRNSMMAQVEKIENSV